MIPISRDKKVCKKVDGVTYTFKPPVGDFEFDVIYGMNEDAVDLKKHYSEAVELLEKEYKGKRKPVKKQWEVLIKEKIMSLMDVVDKTKDYLKSIDATINLACVGWIGDMKLPEFKLGDCAADMPMELKTLLYEWYMGLRSMEEDEVKN